MQRPHISPAVYSLLRHCHLTTASPQRSFSMLRKLLVKDGSFKIENVKQCMILLVNSFAFGDSKVAAYIRCVYYTFLLSICAFSLSKSLF